MSWDDSDKEKKNDPWSGRKKEQGPPDLDEVVRAMQEKLGGLFGGGKKGTGGKKVSGAPLGGGLILLFVVAVVIWFASGIYIVDEGNRGIVLRFGKYVETTLPGPHWRLPTPIEKAVVINVDKERFVEIGYRSAQNRQSATSIRKEALMLTDDENIIDVRLAVQYRIKNAQEYLFNVRNPDLTLKQAAESALRSVIGKNKMDFVLTEGRSEVVATVQKSLQEMIDLYGVGLVISSVNLVEAQPPEEVQGAFSDAIKSREDKQRYINEAEAYANEVVPKARGAASRIIQEAEAYQERVKAESVGDASRFDQIRTVYEAAPEVTRRRLYMETMEEVLGNTSKVIMDVKDGNNMMYLPIDKLLESSGQTSTTISSESNRFVTPANQAVPATSGRETSYRDRTARVR